MSQQAPLGHGSGACYKPGCNENGLVDITNGGISTISEPNAAINVAGTRGILAMKCGDPRRQVVHEPETAQVRESNILHVPISDLGSSQRKRGIAPSSGFLQHQAGFACDESVRGPLDAPLSQRSRDVPDQHHARLASLGAHGGRRSRHRLPAGRPRARAAWTPARPHWVGLEMWETSWNARVRSTPLKASCCYHDRGL